MIIAERPPDLTHAEAWRELEEKIRPFVARRLPTHADVDDVVQDIFLRIQRGLPKLRDERRFGPWVYQVARTAVVDHLRGRARHPSTDREPTEQTYEHKIDEDLVDLDVAAAATRFVFLLPSPYREALMLTELEGRSQKDAAAMLGVSLSAMKSRVQRGRQKLRVALEDCCHIALDARQHVIGWQLRPDAKMPKGCCT